MRQKPLFWHLFPTLLCVEIITLAAVAGFAIQSFRTFHYDRTRASLESTARCTALHVLHSQSKLDPANVNELCASIGELAGVRLTVVMPGGVVIADTDYAPAGMDNHADRPEIIQAWKTGLGVRERLSGTLQEAMMYVAVSLRSGDSDLAVVRAAHSLDDINKAVLGLTRKLVFFGVGVAAFGALLSLLVARRITRPLNQIRDSAEAFARGLFEHHLPSSTVSEIDVLTSTLNRMSDELNQRIAMITRQRDEENALLSCMTESVLAVDMDRHLIKMNGSARELFHVLDAEPGKTSIAEIIRNADLLNIVDRTLASDMPVEGEILIPDRERYLQAHGTALTNSSGEHIGAVLVINDVTRLRRLATMRRDFVANVSHELKTPITSIKGFAETLLEEAPEGDGNAARFLGIICNQADRLKSIVEDLLALADIENSAEKNAIEFARVSVRSIIESAVAAQIPSAEARKVVLSWNCSPELHVSVNLQLLEQAVGNLINNAIKYSGDQTHVEVSARCVGDEAVIMVQDEGPGIARKHLSRLFERFYRVDKSRSRKLGGTGLGLAIVKRITLAHGGHVQVESKMGEGSTFTIFLPLLFSA